MRRSLRLRRRACWEPTDWRSSASSTSSRWISVWPARPAMIAASFSALASWAPVIPVVLRATSVRSRSSASGLPSAGERRVASRPSRAGGEDDHRPLLLLEAVELHQQLVQRLLALGGAAVAAAGAVAADRVELVDED